MVVGDQIGPYQLHALIGVGGMGEVYRARDTKLQRDVAIKILPPSVATDPDRLARFTREAQVLASLNHPHIAQIYGVEESRAQHGDTTSALILELVDGPTLADRISATRLAIEDVIAVAQQIVEALEAAHEQGIVHRDLKPANIKVRDDGTVKVLDFGLAKMADDATNRSSNSEAQSPTITTPALTVAGMILGTAAYMSPEQAKGRPADRRSDIWSFGCVLYEMLTRKRAFEGDDVAETLAAVLRAEPDYTALPADLPRSIARLLRRCLQKDRKWRLQHIGDARLELAAAAKDEVEVSVINDSVRRTHTPLPWIAGVVAAVAAVASIAWAWTRASPMVADPVQFTIMPPTDTSFGTPSGGGTGLVSQVAFSPDGRHIAFVVQRSMTHSIWVRPLDSPDARPLAGTEGGAFPFWSPDSRFLAFFADGSLKRIDIAGGPAQTLCDAVSGRGGTWSSQDVIVFAANTFGPLKRVSAGGGVPEDISTLDTAYGETAHRFPWFLPDGTHYLFTGTIGTCCPAAKAARVKLGSLQSKDATVLLTAESNAQYAGGVLYYNRAQTSTLMAQPFDAGTLSINGEPQPIIDGLASEGSRYASFSVDRRGSIVFARGLGRVSQLTWFDRTGRPLSRLGEAAIYENLALSPNERQVTTSIMPASASRGAAVRRDLWVIDVESQSRTRVTFDPGDDAAPVYSPDGTQIAFGGDRGGLPVLLTKRISGTGVEGAVIDRPQLDRWGLTDPRSSPRSILSPTDWSKDGRYIFFTSAQGVNGSSDIWALPIADHGKPFPVVATPATDADAVLSPDGRWVAYTSAESGVNEIYVQPFPNAEGGKRQVSDGGGAKAIWRADGKELFYFNASTRALMAVPVTTRDGFQKGLATPLFTLPAVFGTGGGALSRQYAVTADGLRFLVNAVEEHANVTPLSVMLNRPAKPGK